MEVEIKCQDNETVSQSVWHFIAWFTAYFTVFLLEGVNINWCQSELLYLAPNLMYVECLLVNPWRSIFCIADPSMADGGRRALPQSSLNTQSKCA